MMLNKTVNNQSFSLFVMPLGWGFGGVIFRILTYFHTTSPDSCCHGLGKEEKKRERARKDENGKKDRTTEEPEGRWRECSAQDFCTSVWGRKWEQENRLGPNTEEGEWKFPNDRNRWQLQAKPFVLFWWYRFRRNSGYQNFTGSYIFSLLLPFLPICQVCNQMKKSQF